MFPQGKSLVIADGGLPSLIAMLYAREAATAASSPADLAPIIWVPQMTGAFPNSGASERGEASPQKPKRPTPPNSGHSGGGGDPVGLARRCAAETQAAKLGLHHIDGHAPWADPSEDAPRSTGHAQSQMLIAAAYAAAELNCSAVVWPVHLGRAHAPNVDQLAKVIDRALLTTRLVGLDSDEHNQSVLDIHTPFADLSDTQLAELALDIDAPISECWWWGPPIEALGGTVNPESPPIPTRVPTFARPEFQRWIAALREVRFFQPLDV